MLSIIEINYIINYWGGIIMSKEEQKERNVKIELTKAKMLLNTENKELAFSTFFNILNNSEINIKYRLEALSYLALNKLTIDEVIQVLKNILLTEELQEFDYISLSRKFKELNKLDELSNIIMEVANNNSYNSNKRFHLIKLAFDLLNEDFKKELINKITLADNSIDFLNLISIIKNNPNYIEIVSSILSNKINDTPDFFNRIIYYNIFANLYGLKNLYNFIIDTYTKEYKVDYIILLYILLFYFKDKALLKELESFIENNFRDSFIYIFFYNLREVLFKNKILYYFLNFEELYNKNRNLFLSFLGFIFTKKLIEDFSDYINSFTDYRGVIFKRLINSFIKEDMVDIINRFDISNGENEYFVEEQAIIELNEVNFDFQYSDVNMDTIKEEKPVGVVHIQQEQEVEKTKEIEQIKESQENTEIKQNIEIEAQEPIETKETIEKMIKTEEIPETLKFKETVIEETKETIKAKEDIEKKEVTETIDKDTDIYAESVTDIVITEKVNQIESLETKDIQDSKNNEDIMSEIEQEIEKIVFSENKKELEENKESKEKQKELENQLTESIISEEHKDLSTSISLNQQQLAQKEIEQKEQKIDIDEIIKNFSNLDKDLVDNLKNKLINDQNFKEDFFVKLEDYILNENNIKNDLNNINVLFNFVKNIDNTYFSKFLRALIAILLGYDFNTLANIIYSTVGINKMSLKEYFIENELLDFNLSINDFINFIQFVVDKNLESAEKIIPLLVSLTEFKELNDSSKDKINHLISDLIKLI